MSPSWAFVPLDNVAQDVTHPVASQHVLHPGWDQGAFLWFSLSRSHRQQIIHRKVCAPLCRMWALGVSSLSLPCGSRQHPGERSLMLCTRAARNGAANRALAIPLQLTDVCACPKILLFNSSSFQLKDDPSKSRSCTHHRCWDVTAVLQLSGRPRGVNRLPLPLVLAVGLRGINPQHHHR